MHQKPFYELIRQNYVVYDDYMSRVSSNSALYRIMLSIRMQYCVDSELNIHRKVIKRSITVKSLLRVIKACVKYIFGKCYSINNAKVMILGDWDSDMTISPILNIPLLNINIGWKVPSFRTIGQFFVTWWTIVRIFQMRRLNFVYLVNALPNMILSEKIYYEFPLSDIHLILTSNDVTAYNVALLFKAQHEGIIRLKFEYAQINSLMHDNVFADYYFYPSTLHLKIRQVSPMNSGLKYIEGGYVNYNKMVCNCNESIYCPEKLITYFTGHSNLYEFDDHYYIAQVLEQKPANYRLAIKIHPYDKVEAYNYLCQYGDVVVYTFNDIGNDQLINHSSVCLSQDSAMSLEAKLICENSYFLNYTWRTCCYADDFAYMNEYFETIDSPEFLHQVLYGDHTPVSIDVFKAHVDFTYPHTLDVFKKTINNLLLYRSDESK